MKHVQSLILEIIVADTNLTSTCYNLPAGSRADLHPEAPRVDFSHFFFALNQIKIPIRLSFVKRVKTNTKNTRAISYYLYLAADGLE